MATEDLAWHSLASARTRRKYGGMSGQVPEKAFKNEGILKLQHCLAPALAAFFCSQGEVDAPEGLARKEVLMWTFLVIVLLAVLLFLGVTGTEGTRHRR
jgi:hypothetical protein